MFAFVHFADDLSGSRYDETPLKHFYALFQRIKRRFTVQLQTERRELLLDLRLAFPEKIFVRIQQEEIVHIPDVIFHVHTFFDIVIQIVENRESDELRHLRSETDSRISSEAIYNLASSERDLRILYSLAYSRFCHVVPYALEVMPDIAFENPTVGAELLTIFPQVRRDPVQRIIDASSSHTSAIIGDKRSRYLIVKSVIA